MIKRIIQYLTPPDKWKFPVIILTGIFVGLGFYVFYIANMPSYLSDNPATCVNCHVMAPQFATWNHSAHREVAVCNDCHVPQDNIFKHYLFKATDGLRHAYMFTFRLEPQVMTIKQAGKDAVQNNCIRCHEHVIYDSKMASTHPMFEANIKDKYCSECHRDTPHGRVKSASSVPDARVPLPPSPVPDWLKRETKKVKTN